VSATLGGLAYKIDRHVHVYPGTHVKVVLRCIGWPKYGLRPDVESREIDLLVPSDDLGEWRLGRLVRVNVTVTAR